ncbi:MAG: F0F1 ATP synthase subunit A [Bacteroidia bacterium]
MLIRNLLIITFLLCGAPTLFAEESEPKFDAAKTILHHILDTHDWHITDIPTGKDAEGHATYTPVALHLPWFFYSSRDGFVFASGTEDLLHKGYVPFEEALHALKPDAPTEQFAHGHGHMSEADWHTFEAAHVDEHVTILDLSITKTSLQMLMIGLLLVFTFIAVRKSFERNRGQAPKGIQSFFEPIIVFVRDEVARPYLHDKADAFLPYLLTLFFFIWFSNLFGLMPFNSNIAGNISVTAALAVLTFIITQVRGSKDYWTHIFNTPGVPWVLKFVIPIMPIVEFIGIFTKPFALAVRLFANITAGHFMVLGLVSLIFIMSNAGESLTGGLAIMPISVLFSIVIFALEMIVAIVQPFIFTLLTAVFVGMAMESHAHDDHHHQPGHQH